MVELLQKATAVGAVVSFRACLDRSGNAVCTDNAGVDFGFRFRFDFDLRVGGEARGSWRDVWVLIVAVREEVANGCKATLAFNTERPMTPRHKMAQKRFTRPETALEAFGAGEYLRGGWRGHGEKQFTGLRLELNVAWERVCLNYFWDARRGGSSTRLPTDSHSMLSKGHPIFHSVVHRDW